MLPAPALWEEPPPLDDEPRELVSSLIPYAFELLDARSGYPAGTTRFYMVEFYKQAFTFQNMGYGSALAWLLFVVALMITLFLFGTARYWVYYAGDNNS